LPRTDEQRLKERLHASRRNAIKQGSQASLTPSEWKILCDYFNDRCAYCFLEGPLEQDHVIPISKGGAHTAENVVPACKSCNSSKSDRSLLVFIREVEQTLNERDKG
jgi:5-methylcytosine-specific restriction endonuclease McrA